jgi:hypothetical protein
MTARAEWLWFVGARGALESSAIPHIARAREPAQQWTTHSQKPEIYWPERRVQVNFQKGSERRFRDRFKFLFIKFMEQSAFFNVHSSAGGGTQSPCSNRRQRKTNGKRRLFSRCRKPEHVAMRSERKVLGNTREFSYANLAARGF